VIRGALADVARVRVGMQLFKCHLTTDNLTDSREDNYLICWFSIVILHT